MVITDPFFKHFSREFDRMLQQPPRPTYPPHNIIKYSDDSFELEFAVAGFKKKDISVTVHDGVLNIKGAQEEEAADINYVYKGIAARRFERSFALPDFFEVASAAIEDGILRVSLNRNVPEEKKPKQISID